MRTQGQGIQCTKTLWWEEVLLTIKSLKMNPITYMGMEIFSGEGLDPNFPLGGGVIFQPRGGPGGGPKVWDF